MNDTKTVQELPAHQSIPNTIDMILTAISEGAEAAGLSLTEAISQQPSNFSTFYILMGLLRDTRIPDKHKDELRERLRGLMEKAPPEQHALFEELIALKGKKSDSQDAGTDN